MKDYRRVTFHPEVFCAEFVGTGEDAPDPVFPGVIPIFLVLIAIGIAAVVGRFLFLLAGPKAGAAWKGKKVGFLFSPECNAGEEEVLLYKSEKYRDDAPPPEYN